MTPPLRRLVDGEDVTWSFVIRVGAIDHGRGAAPVAPLLPFSGRLRLRTIRMVAVYGTAVVADAGLNLSGCDAGGAGASPFSRGRREGSTQKLEAVLAKHGSEIDRSLP